MYFSSLSYHTSTVGIIKFLSFVSDDLIIACPCYKTVGVYWVLRKQSGFYLFVNIFYEIYTVVLSIISPVI
jgi:hypothetical protein